GFDLKREMTNLRRKKGNNVGSDKVSVANLFNSSKPGTIYFQTLSEPALLSAQDYVVFRIREIPLITSTTPISILKEWNSWMRSLKDCDSGAWSFAASRAPAVTKRIVSGWISQESNSLFPQSSDPQPLFQSPQPTQTQCTQSVQSASSPPAQF
ncbi:hypothetical protein BGZ49_006226, partial [Haplosporangium sp. Z 27]